MKKPPKVSKNTPAKKGVRNTKPIQSHCRIAGKTRSKKHPTDLGTAPATAPARKPMKGEQAAEGRLSTREKTGRSNTPKFKQTVFPLPRVP